MSRWRGAVVTGAASGIGRALALELAAGGTDLVLADVQEEGAQRTAERARARGVKTSVVRCDVRSPEEVESLARHAETTLPAVDLLCNNAGVLVAGAVEDLALEDYARVIDVNLWGVIHGIHAFLPGMRRRGRGALLNTASVAGTLSPPRMGAYNATKAAVIALTETLAAELVGSGVTATALCPSFTASGFANGGTGPASERTRAVARFLVERLGASPSRVAHLGLEAVAQGALYAVATVHGRAAWRTARMAPSLVAAALGGVARFV